MYVSSSPAVNNEPVFFLGCGPSRQIIEFLALYFVCTDHRAKIGAGYDVGDTSPNHSREICADYKVPRDMTEFTSITSARTQDIIGVTVIL
jgi:hypothetical protein